MTEIFKANPCDDSINYIWALTRRPYIARWMNDPTPAGFVRFLDAWRAQLLVVFFVTHDGEPVGMIHLVPEGEALTAHIAFDKAGWGHAEEAARQVRRLCGDQTVQAFIPTGNRLAIHLARRIGREIGPCVMDDENCTQFEFERESCPH